MHIGYKLVIFNLLVVFFLSSLCIIYRYIYPKKKISPFFLLIILSLLPVLSIARTGVYSSGDMGINIVKTMAFYASLQDGTFFPTWAKDLNATYGYPLFIFTYPLPYYVASLFHSLGFSFIASIKLLLATSFVGSGITMYVWLKEKVNKQLALLGSIFYLYAPYHLIDIHFRVDIGENTAFVFLPLVFLAIDKSFRSKNRLWQGSLSVCICFLILSHQAVSLFFIPISFFYVLFMYMQNKKKKKTLFITLVSFFLGIGLAAYYWLPVLGESMFTHQIEYMKSVSFQPLSLYLFSPWRYGLLFQGPMGQLSYPIGYIQILLLVLGMYMLIKKSYKQPEKQVLLFSVIIFLVLLFLTQEVSKPAWDLLPIFKNIQFTYRLSGILMFLTSFIVVIVLQKIQKQWILMSVCFFVIMSTLLNWGSREVVSTITDQSLANGLPLSTAAAEGLQPASPKWTNKKHIWMTSVPKQHAEIIQGIGTIQEKSRLTTLHSYVVLAKSTLRIQENTLYFPGWLVIVDGKKTPIHISSSGVITYNVTKGYHSVNVLFLDTPLQKVSKAVSLLSVVLLFWLIKFRDKKRLTD